MTSPSAEEEHYNDTNRAFLQAFLSRSILTLKEAKPILAAISSAHDDRETLPEDITESDLNNYISRANQSLSAFDLEIRSTYSQHQQQNSDKTRIYAIVNTTSDSITQLATIHTADEISFVKRVLDAIFLTYNTKRVEICAVTGMQAIQLHKIPSGTLDGEGNHIGNNNGGGVGGGGLSAMQAEKVLTGLVEEGWFERSKAGFYSLSPRGLMELRGWLLDTYNGGAGGEEEEGGEDESERAGDRVKLCFACREIITVWTGKDFVGEKVVTTSERYLQGKRRSGFASSQARRSTLGMGNDGVEERT
ncbi:MAG: hypothetical protein M1812_002525 [Candelaria pacifica]|nr:MAG: hypothetical protein M1812_002525 [Candelaria pacifica]